ncbi:hypothetical protein PTB13_24430, partial [Bacillus sp. MHSD17]|nr:hypothetical protein [Bacillus sp. MHSD17]
MKKSRSIALKLSSLIIGIFLLLFFAYTIITGIILKNQSVDDAESATLETAEFSAAKMSERFKKANTTLLTTKRIVETMEKKGEVSAQAILDIMETNLVNNDDLLGVGVILEKDIANVKPIALATLLEQNTMKIDSATYAALTDSKNRFIPYLSKDGGGITAAAIEG